MKFTDEELSMIMSAHDNGRLTRFGYCGKNTEGVCVAQAAYGIHEECDGLWAKYDEEQEEFARVTSKWFDFHYRPSWTTEEFLAQLEAQGWA